MLLHMSTISKLAVNLLSCTLQGSVTKPGPGFEYQVEL